MNKVLKRGFSSFLSNQNLKWMAAQFKYQRFGSNQNNKHSFTFKCINFFALSLISSLIVFKDKIYCKEDNKQQKSVETSKQLQIEIFQLNKIQLVNLLANINEQSLLIIFDKYFRNQHQKQFAKQLQNLYNQCKQTKIPKIYLVQKNDVRHLQIFQRLLKQQQIQKSNNQNLSSNQKKTDSQAYYFLTPSFPNNPFKIQEESQIQEQIRQIRKFKIRINPKNPKDINQQIFLPYDKIFNRTTVIKQCPEYFLIKNQNRCLQQYQSNVATLIQQGMLKNKSQQFRFYALTPISRKDNSIITNFHNSIKARKNQIPQSSQNVFDDKVENIFVLRNDLLGKQIDDIKNFKKKNYSNFKKLTSFDKLTLFIKPRIFIISKMNPSIDLYWYVTCLKKNLQPSISISNTDSFLLGQKYQITNGLEYPLNTDLQLIKILYKNHPQLNYVIVNSEIVSELIRHLHIKNQFVLFNLTNSLVYPKIFLPNYDKKLTPQDNYQNNFKPLIQKYLKQPKVYDKVILDKEKQLTIDTFKNMVKNKENKFVLRVCDSKCTQDLTQPQLKHSFNKLQNQSANFDQSQNSDLSNSPKYYENRNWKNKVYSSTYWIDSHYKFTGLKNGDYLFQKGNFSSL